MKYKFNWHATNAEVWHVECDWCRKFVTLGQPILIDPGASPGGVSVVDSVPCALMLQTLNDEVS